MNVDSFFMYALRKSDAVKKLVSKRIFNTAREEDDEKADKIPYCIVTFDGSEPSEDSKDDVFARPDRAKVSVLCVAVDRPKVVELVNAVMDAVQEQMEEGDYYDTYPEDPQIAHVGCVLDAADYDAFDKPAHFQWMHFSCELN